MDDVELGETPCELGARKSVDEDPAGIALLVSAATCGDETGVVGGAMGGTEEIAAEAAPKTAMSEANGSGWLPEVFDDTEFVFAGGAKRDSAAIVCMDGTTTRAGNPKARTPESQCLRMS